MKANLCIKKYIIILDNINDIKQLNEIHDWEEMIGNVVNCDCLLAMKLLPDKCVDLVVTSPPYDNLRDYDGFNFDFEKTAKELFRIVNDGGVLVWVVGDATVDGNETGTSFRQVLYFKEIGFNLHDTMIYEKVGAPFPEINRYYQIFEYMFVLSKGTVASHNLIKDRKNNYEGSTVSRLNHARQKDGTLKASSSYGKNKKIKEYGVRFNIWRISNQAGIGHRDKIANNHPATFPEKLATDHIKSWSNENDIVLDPFAGSGTTLRACKDLNRRFIGMEISKKYCEITDQRLRQEVMF